MSPQSCKVCDGRRLRNEVLAVTLSSEYKPVEVFRYGGLSIMDVCDMSIDNALLFFQGLKLDSLGKKIAADMIIEITSRLKFLQKVFDDQHAKVANDQAFVQWDVYYPTYGHRFSS